MGFEELLRQKLGPMRDLVTRAPRPDLPDLDPAQLFYRRAVGLELVVRPEETWSVVEVVRERERLRLDAREAALVLGLTRWTPASALPLRPAELWRLVEQDLLFFATEDPGVALTGRAGVLQEAREKKTRVARRASMWPICAVETAVEIAPMPFMPRGDDLRGAELVGVRFASLERGFEVLGVTITGSARLGALLRRLTPRLDGSRTPEEVVDAFADGDRADVKNLLELLDRLTILEVVSERPVLETLRAPAGPQVTWLGHAGVLVQTAGKSVLVDPIFYSISEPEDRWVRPRKFDPRRLPPLDAILITHGDNDHLNPNSLLQLPHDVPVFIPRLGQRPKYQVDLRGVLSVLGFSEVYELEDWASVDLGGAVVTACPFEGEDWGLDLATATYLVESKELSVYLSADSAAMDETYRRLAARPRRIDLAFMGVCGNAETYVMPQGLGYGNFYRDWIPRARHNQWVRHCAGPAESAHSLALFNPRFTFGYAAGGASFIRTEYSDTGDHEQLADLVLAAAGQGALDTRPVALPLGVPVALADLPAWPNKG